MYESDIAKVKEGYTAKVSTLAYPDSVFKGVVDKVNQILDPVTKVMKIRVRLSNPGMRLKPEMFANVTIYSGSDHPAVGVPKRALIYEGDQVRLWVAHEDKSIELRQIKTGLTNGNLVEVWGNLEPGEQIVTKGSLFIDRAASGS